MSLLDIATAITTQMTAAEPELALPIVFGADPGLSVDRSSPVIVLVPGSEQIAGAMGQGGDGITQPRPLFTRITSVAAHIWCCDVPTVELTLNAFVQAMQTIQWGAYKLQSGQWRTGSDIATKWGVVYTLNMTWLIPITRVADTFATVTSWPQTLEVDPIVHS